MHIDRRRLLSRAMRGAAAACAIPSWATLAHADEPSAAKKSQDQPTDPVRVRDGDELQRLLDNKAASGGGVVRLARDSELTCLVRHVPIARETSIHALLVPQGVALDLN